MKTTPLRSTNNVPLCFTTALQLADYPYGNGIDVIFAGGRREFIPNNETDPEYPDKKGDREDGRNLIGEWVDKHPNSMYVWNKEQFDKIDVKKVDQVIGWLFLLKCILHGLFLRINEMVVLDSLKLPC